MCAREKESLMEMETVLCSSGFVPVSSSSIHRKAVPSFPTQADTVSVFMDLNQVTVCRALQLNISRVRLLLQSTLIRGDWLSWGISNKRCLAWCCWLQSHPHRCVMKLLHEQLRGLHFFMYGKVERTLLCKANLENQS